MTIYLGSDHGGFNLKEYLKNNLKNDGYDVVDCGPAERVEGDDYPDYATLVAKKVSLTPDLSRGILIAVQVSEWISPRINSATYGRGLRCRPTRRSRGGMTTISTCCALPRISLTRRPR